MKPIIGTLFLLTISMGFSQTVKKVEDHQLTVNFLLPGLIYEHGIAQNSTLTAEATMGFAFRGCSGCTSDFGIYPIGRFQYRYYYNFGRRELKGKNTSGNSGNYIAPTFGIQSGKALIGDLDFTSDFFSGIGAVYGLQRTGAKGLQFRFEVGPAYFLDEFDDDLGLLLALKLGWVVNKRKK